jgi:hypothetical protein
MRGRFLFSLPMTLCFALLVLSVRVASGQTAEELLKDQEIRKTLELINQARAQAGLAEVSLSAELSQGCTKHAQYLVLNRGNPRIDGLKAHEEDEALKGASKEGAAAGKAAVIHFVKPSQAVSGWLATFYHRIPLLQPALEEVGIGSASDKRETVCLVDCIRGVSYKDTTDKKKARPVVYFPEDGQTDVPIAMGPEIPSPLPKDHKGKAGFPITVYFATRQDVKKVAVLVTGSDDMAVPAYVSSPEFPATTFTQWNTVCIIPKHQLAMDTTYRVKLTCELSGKLFERSWKFTTEKSK